MDVDDLEPWVWGMVGSRAAHKGETSLTGQVSVRCRGRRVGAERGGNTRILVQMR